jgi:carboxypeptidase C (cathepsin A)
MPTILVCSTVSTQDWIYDIGADPKSNELWKPGRYNQQTAGYITQFDLGATSNSSFTFVTVHGAGHDVPAYRPAESLALVKSFFQGHWDDLF